MLQVQLPRLGEGAGLVQNHLAEQPQELGVKLQCPTTMTWPSKDIKEPTSHSEPPFNYFYNVLNYDSLASYWGP